MKSNEIILNKMVKDLSKLCKIQFKLNDLPSIVFIENEDSIEGKSFGQFDGKEIKVVIKNRHPIDIMRTLSHEIAHYKQMMDGENMDGSTGSEIENNANAAAGIIMRKFAERHPDYFIFD